MRDNILIVDDTPANLRLLANILSEHGYRVRPVTNGKLALTAVKAETPDMILLDIRMPEMDGYQVCEQLKSDTATCDIPIIFISALDATEDKVKAFDVGGVDYITKPFHVEEVLARVETHLAIRRLRNDLLEANKKMERELKLAGEIQTGLLPQLLPQIAGWQFFADLIPARATSGDFYDVNMLPDGRIYFLVADVVDKGAGAALFMALCVTLIRTYIMENPSQPVKVLQLVNQRILADTGGEQFVSLFLGILDPITGVITYCNAGHPPGYLIASQSDGDIRSLEKTGITLGVTTDELWGCETIEMNNQDLLFLYSDGITDAANDQGEFYGSSALLQSLQKNKTLKAPEIRQAILDELQMFVGDAPQQDDIALVIVKRV